MTNNLESDLNATIAAAVNARIEAQVAEAMAGDEMLGRYVQSALRQTVEVNKRDGSYGKERVSFLSATLGEAIQQATKRAVAAYFEQSADALEAEVAKALRSNSKDIAATLVASLAEKANKAYGVNVAMSLKFPQD